MGSAASALTGGLAKNVLGEQCPLQVCDFVVKRELWVLGVFYNAVCWAKLIVETTLFFFLHGSNGGSNDLHVFLSDHAWCKHVAGNFGGISLREGMKCGLVSYNDTCFCQVTSSQVLPEEVGINISQNSCILPFDRSVFVVRCVVGSNIFVLLGQVEGWILNRQDMYIQIIDMTNYIQVVQTYRLSCQSVS